MVLGRRRAEDGHDVARAALVRGHHVGVALDEHDVAALAHFGKCAIERVDEAALLEQVRLGRVHVLRPRLVAVVESSRAEAHDGTREVADGDRHAAAEEVVRPALVRAAHEPRALGRFERQVRAAEGGHQGRPARRCVTDRERLRRRSVEPALLEVARRSTALGTLNFRAEEAAGEVEDGSYRIELGVALAGGRRTLREIDAGAGREDLDRFAERDVVALLDEPDHVPTRSARSVAAPRAAPRIDLERRRALVVERTARHPQRARLLQGRHAFTDHVLDRRAQLDRFERSAELVVDHGGVTPGVAGAGMSRTRGRPRQDAPRKWEGDEENEGGVEASRTSRKEVRKETTGASTCDSKTTPSKSLGSLLSRGSTDAGPALLGQASSAVPPPSRTPRSAVSRRARSAAAALPNTSPTPSTYEGRV